MPIITYKGHVDWGGHTLTLPGPEALNVLDTPFGVDLSFRIEIKQSKITATCTYAAPFDGHVGKIYFYCLNAVQTIVNLTAFQLGFGAITVLDSYEEPGHEGPLILSEPTVKSVCTAFKSGNGYTEMLTHVLDDVNFMGAINDLIQGLSNPHLTFINCARATEAIRTLIAGVDIKPEKAWKKMQVGLNAEEDYLGYITDASKKHRHGHFIYLPPGVRSEVLKRSWEVMNRFMHYRLGGNKPLPTNKFPVLRDGA